MGRPVPGGPGTGTAGQGGPAAGRDGGGRGEQQDQGSPCGPASGGAQPRAHAC